MREIAAAFCISGQRVRQIIKKYEQIIEREQEIHESHDPLLKAVGNGSISQKAYNSLVRGGYGKTFDFDDLLTRLRSATFNSNEFAHFGDKSISQLRHTFLSQDEVAAIENDNSTF